MINIPTDCLLNNSVGKIKANHRPVIERRLNGMLKKSHSNEEYDLQSTFATNQKSQNYGHQFAKKYAPGELL